MAHGFEKAGKIEKALKDLGVPYDAQVTAEPCNPKAKKKGTKMRITKIEVAAIIAASQSHPAWDKYAIAKSIGCSRATVERVLSNTHVLQKKGAAPKVHEGRLQ